MLAATEPKEYVTDETYLHLEHILYLLSNVKKSKNIYVPCHFRKYAKWTNPNLARRRKKIGKV